MSLDVLPLAITMLVGPGIMAAVILVTTERPIPVSAAYVLGFVISTAAGVAVAMGIVALTGIDLGDPDDSGSTGTIIQLTLVGLLIVASLVTFLRRASSEPPKWLGSLMEATPFAALKMGLLIVVIMPSDDVIMLTVGRIWSTTAPPTWTRSRSLCSRRWSRRCRCWRIWCFATRPSARCRRFVAG